ncbi:MAG: protein kinase [Nanoarchaeota archaeon]|nr:protein kinase [Nanoarchaeota archaeon]
MQGETSESDIFRDTSHERLLRHFFGTKMSKKDQKARERRKKQIERGIVRPGEMLDDYMVYQLNPGCAARAKKSRNSIPSFNIWDAGYLPEDEDRALKTPNPILLLDRPNLEDFLKNEWRVLSLLRHRNIIRAFKPVWKGEVLYLPLEYLPYQLHQVIGKRPTLEGIAFFALEAAKAVQYLKQEEVVHGDIKPQQFMVCHDPEDPRHSIVKLLDFGAAMHPRAIPPGIIYTPSYLAPESIQAVSRAGPSNEEKIATFTHKSDVYSLGLSYAKVALSSAMHVAEISSLFTEPGKVAKLTIEAMYDHHLPYRFNCILERMMAEDPNERIDADEVVRRLHDFMFTFNLGPKVVINRDLYSGDVTDRRVDRPY